MIYVDLFVCCICIAMYSEIFINRNWLLKIKAAVSRKLTLTWIFFFFVHVFSLGYIIHYSGFWRATSKSELILFLSLHEEKKKKKNKKQEWPSVIFQCVEFMCGKMHEIPLILVDVEKRLTHIFILNDHLGSIRIEAENFSSVQKMCKCRVCIIYLFRFFICCTQTYKWTGWCIAFNCIIALPQDVTFFTFFYFAVCFRSHTSANGNAHNKKWLRPVFFFLLFIANKYFMAYLKKEKIEAFFNLMLTNCNFMARLPHYSFFTNILFKFILSTTTNRKEK